MFFVADSAGRCESHMPYALPHRADPNLGQTLRNFLLFFTIVRSPGFARTVRNMTNVKKRVTFLIKATALKPYITSLF